MINFAVVGCGRISARHFQYIREVKNARLFGACDVEPDKLRNACAQFQAKSFDCFEALLKDKNIDVVDICTPSGLHAKMAIEAMKNGKHVVVEKPMALKVSDGWEMIKVAKKFKRKLCVVLQNRYNSPVMYLQKKVNSNALGKIYLAKVTVRWYRPQEYYDDGWHGTEKMDGGALMNQAIHHIDILQWLLGIPKSAYCYKGTLGHRMEMEDVAVAVLKFPNNAMACIEASTICWPKNLEGSIAIFGENGSIKIGGVALDTKVLSMIKGGGEDGEVLDGYGKNISVYGESHKKVITDMVEAIKKDRQPKTNGIEGIKSLQVVEALYKSAKEGKEVFL